MRLAGRMRRELTISLYPMRHRTRESRILEHMLAATLSAAIAMAQPNLDQICHSAFVAAKTSLPAEKLDIGDVSITVMQREGTKWQVGGFEQDTPMYPASVVKLFWLAFAHHSVTKWSDEDLRAAKEMIVDSNNDATGHIVNLSTGALPGPELQGKDFDKWSFRRHAANRWFKSLGYEKINVLNRTYNEGPFGREAQIIKVSGRNSLTTRATALLMSRFADDQVEPRRSIVSLRQFLKRDISSADEQVKGYLGGIMPTGTQHWSKAGWTSEVKHDVSHDIMPDGRQFVFCIFTKRPDSEVLIHLIGRELLKGLGYPTR